jgi:para-nitrobenzyl esterase
MLSRSIVALPFLLAACSASSGDNLSNAGGTSGGAAGSAGASSASGGATTGGSAGVGTTGGASGSGGSNDGGSGGASLGGSSGAGGACPSGVSPSPGVVITDRGAIQGMMETGTWAFLGVPYAAPPTGDLRWAATAAHDCWSDTLSATSFGAMCLQVDPNDTTKAVGQEDCLTANVWVPQSAASATALPVLVFIHGGGNVQGSASDTGTSGARVYDGAAFATAANAIVVTFQYRLGALGFLAHPSFGQSPGNYGTLDQIFALGWVQRNIAAFGGDPAHVLLFGQSAGAEDVCNMVASPLAKGLFSAALMESGGCTGKPLATAETFAHTWATKASCDSAADPAACMRALDGTALTLLLPEPASVAGGKQGDYEPDIDGVAMIDSSDKVIAAGMHNHVPFVIGSNSDETSLELAKAFPMGMTADQYSAAVLAYVGGSQTLASQVMKQYPVTSFATPVEAYIQVTTDAKFTSGARYAARSAAMGQPETPVWRYFYDHKLDDGTAVEKALGAWHAQELAFLFRSVATSTYMPSAGEETLSSALETSWAAMAAVGAPSTGGVTWPAYDATTDPYTALDDTFTPATGLRTSQSDFWDMVLGR